jgi:hypothetical protein
LLVSPDLDEAGYAENTTLALGANGLLTLGGSASARLACKNLTLDLTADGTTVRTANVIASSTGRVEIDGLAFLNSGYRTARVLLMTGENHYVSGADFSGFTNATVCEITGSTARTLVLNNCLTAATWTPVDATPSYGYQWEFYNCGPADAPTYLYVAKSTGTVASSADIYRTDGAAVEGDATSWLITTTATCGESNPMASPWWYGLVSSTGSRTFDCFITNDTADFDDSMVWLEIQHLGTVDEAQWTLAKDQRATITTTAAAQSDDVTSAWNGAGPSFTYKQKLSVTATVNEAGQYRARVVVGVASIASSRYFYVDPKATVT